MAVNKENNIERTKRFLFRIIPYEKMVRLADWRQRYRWKTSKGQAELNFIFAAIGQIREYVKYFIYLLGFSFGSSLISPEIANKLHQWWPWMANVILWLTARATEMIWLFIIIIIIWEIFKKASWWTFGNWFEKSGFERAEQRARVKRYAYFTMEEIVEPIKRIEKKLGIKKNERHKKHN